MSASIIGLFLLFIVISGVANASFPLLQFESGYPQTARRLLSAQPWDLQDFLLRYQKRMSPAEFRYWNTILGKRYNLMVNNSVKSSDRENNDFSNPEEQITDFKIKNVLYSEVQKPDAMEILKNEHINISTEWEVSSSTKDVNSPIGSLKLNETLNSVTNEINEGTLTNGNTTEMETKPTENSSLAIESSEFTASNTTISNKNEDITYSSLPINSESNSTMSKETQWTESTVSSILNASAQSTISSVDLDYSTPNESNSKADNTADNSIYFEYNSTEKERVQTTNTKIFSWSRDTTASSQNTTDDTTTISYGTTIITTDESIEGNSATDSISSSDSHVVSTNTHKVSISETTSDINGKSSTQYFTPSSNIDVSLMNTDKVSISETSSKPTEDTILSTSDVSSSLSQIVDKTRESGHFTGDEKSTPASSVARIAISEDHIIAISSIHTVKIAVSVVFLAIALIATAILAIYLIKTRRREVQYDQLTLLP